MCGVSERLEARVAALRAAGKPEDYIRSYIKGGWNNAGFKTKVDFDERDMSCRAVPEADPLGQADVHEALADGAGVPETPLHGSVSTERTGAERPRQ